MDDSPVNVKYIEDMDKYISELQSTISSLVDVVQSTHMDKLEDVVYEWNQYTKDYIEELHSYINDLEN